LKLQKRLKPLKPLLNLKSLKRRSWRLSKRNSMISISDEYGTLQERKGLQGPSDSYASSLLNG
jgi:hypothetical protein